jgi:glycosyltransferase involved in cell wall biosynthesis
MSKVRKAVKEVVHAAVNPKRAAGMVRFYKERNLHDKNRRRQYLAWYDRQILTPEQLDEQRQAAKAFKQQPLISILVPTYNTQPDHLRECFESVLSQTYTNWELCIADDASPSEATKAVIQEFVKNHKNIHATFSKKNQHIALTSNIALSMAKGEYISLLDHDDLLEPNALYETVATINKHPNVDLIYTDEDKLEDDKWHVEPFFKPDWSPDFLNSCNYITHFATLSKSIMNKVGGFRTGTEGAQDWDLFLRVTAQTKNIHHVSKILYTWRKSITSTAQTANSKPYAYINQKKVLRHNIGLQGLNATVEGQVVHGFWRTRYSIVGTPLVSIIIPNKDNLKLLRQCVDSILEQTSYPYFEVIIVENGSTEAGIEEYYDQVTALNSEVKVVRWKKPFNYSSVCNFGAEKAKGEYLLFLNNDTEVVTPDWVQALLEHAQRSEVGMVGCKLVFPSRHIQHAGVVLSDRGPFHAFYGQNPNTDIFTYIYINNIRNCSAVTAACTMVARKKFDKVKGFDPTLRVTYNDVDLCLKMLEQGLYNVYTPFAELVHYESMSVGKVNTSERDMSELEAATEVMQKRWSKYLNDDRFYNANFAKTSPGYYVQ